MKGFYFKTLTQMAEYKNILDLSYCVVNNLWKQCISQNAVPSLATEAQGSLLQKLGLTWLPNHAPGFYLSSKQVKILHEPNAFYNLIIDQIKKANNRVVLASLYLGTGKLEEGIVAALKKRLEEKPNLKVKILLDCTRGSRGEMNSRKMVSPLLKDHEKSCQVSLFKSSYLQRPFVPFLPEKYKEIIGLQHIKTYLFDNNFIISGANLSNDYFTNRQDRYIFINDSKELSDFMEGLVDRVSQISLTLDSRNELHSGEGFPHDPMVTDPETFNQAASSWIRNYYESFIENSKTAEGDTIIFPLIEMGPFNIHVDSKVTTRVLQDSEEESCVDLTTGYFNLTRSYMDTIINKSKAQYTILTAHPTANGFYKAKGPPGGIPAAYTSLALNFFKEVDDSKVSHRIKMLEYIRPGWTYHAKGLWLSSTKSKSPHLTMLGSPNFGERSLKHDLECQFLLATTDEELQKNLDQERKIIYEFSHPFTDAVCSEPERRIPLWVKVVVHLFRSYL